jgi:hypothetical protein
MTSRRWIGLCLVAGLSLGTSVRARADAAADWQQIVAMDQNAPVAQWKTREEAQAGAIEYLNKQEDALREFIAAYPEDTHAPDAKLRLAHLLATRADLDQNAGERREAGAVLDELEGEPAMKDRRADVEFARISLFMQRADAVAGANREALLEKARAFAKEFPEDRRLPALLAEVASAFDEDAPRTARTLLEQAQPLAKTPELQARIADDLKRLALLDKPLEMKWTAVDGRRIDLRQMRGKVVLIYFFASWSAPSMLALDWVKGLAGGWSPESIETLGICLDNDPVSVPDMLSDHGIAWPVYCDGRGWQGELVRGLGINTLPQLWIVDRGGVLRSLDAKDDAEMAIRRAGREGGDGRD